MSHDTAIDLIKSIELKGIPIAKIYIDTVGPAVKYKEKLQRFFPKYEFTVAEKADSKYPIVSAASVCAKVMRDRIVQNWKYAEHASLYLDAFKLGSGYPADPDTKKFLEDTVDPVFGYSTLARFSWSTITKALEKHASNCDFNEPEDEEDDPKAFMKQQAMMKGFFKKQPKPGNKQHESVAGKAKIVEQRTRTNADIYFEDRCLFRVTTWT